MSDTSSNGEDGVALSFLDVLSSGLGAAIILFLIFSVLPHFGDSREPGAGSAGGGGSTGSGKTGASPAKDFDAVVGSATLAVLVLIERQNGAQSDGRWPALAERHGFVETGFAHEANPNQQLYMAFVFRGVKPAIANRIRFELSEGARQPFKCTVTLLVGGSSQRKSAEFSFVDGQWKCTEGGGAAREIAANGDHFVPVFHLDLKPNKEWIILP